MCLRMLEKERVLKEREMRIVNFDFSFLSFICFWRTIRDVPNNVEHDFPSFGFSHYNNFSYLFKTLLLSVLPRITLTI